MFKIEVIHFSLFWKRKQITSYSPFRKLLLEKLNIEPLLGCKRNQERKLWFNTGSLVIPLHLKHHRK